ncbi:MAG: hypothetical protein JSW51_08340 [Gemmatimonadota bacterium]|nr:MAG: hypothetical protein JSW51_08340 [Gemmatimonadota bacterium]
MTHDGRREFVGLLLAPVIATLFWGLGTLVWLGIANGVLLARKDVLVVLLGGLFFGLPVAFFVVILFTAPLYAVLATTNRISLKNVLLSGIAVGALAAIFMRWLLPDATLLNLPLGMGVGLATAAVWWLIARH